MYKYNGYIKYCHFLETDPCLFFLCENGGTKTVVRGACECLCPAGYSGSRCETSNHCFGVIFLIVNSSP